MVSTLMLDVEVDKQAPLDQDFGNTDCSELFCFYRNRRDGDCVVGDSPSWCKSV